VALWLVSTIAVVLGWPGANRAGELLGLRAVSGGRRGIEMSQAASGLMRFQHHIEEARPAPSSSPTIAFLSVPSPVASTPPLTTVAVIPPSGSIASIIYAAAQEYGLSGSYLLSVAQCESGLYPRAVNAAGYYGLFQFAQSTWASDGYGSIYDPVAQARTAARLIAGGAAGMWPNCA
jgi:soluble lytic murein transglycosylase-like protein